ncbi:CRISPR-associated endonuclease Cas2 [Metallosphaera sp.]|uniref:CRISPR-associated endonuclease Cas2 n=1 Tax=Metallosphaera sp. TaxID=2020860 RepID=UPI003178F817
MFIIMAYDIEEERVNKVLKVGRRYLTWIQNSVLEGEITEAKYEKLKIELAKIIDKKKDSVIFYVNKTDLYIKKEIMGRERNSTSTII